MISSFVFAKKMFCLRTRCKRSGMRKDTFCGIPKRMVFKSEGFSVVVIYVIIKFIVVRNGVA